MTFFHSQPEEGEEEEDNETQTSSTKLFMKLFPKLFPKEGSGKENCQICSSDVFCYQTFLLLVVVIDGEKRLQSFLHRPIECPSLSLLSINWIIGNFYTPLLCYCDLRLARGKKAQKRFVE